MNKITKAFLTLTAVALSSGTALAQASSNEIIVTAQKRSENLQDVPIAISVVQGDDISPAVSSIDQLIANVPTLNFRRGGSPVDSALLLRGVGTINFSIAAEPSVATVVDGVVLARAGEAFGDLYDIERIEVLRGPQGTLFGKNASAGLINIVTAAPEKKFGGAYEIAVFEDDEQRAKAHVNLPISDTLRTRFSAFLGEYDGNITNLTTGEKINGYSRWGVRAVTDWDASDKLTVRFAADYREPNDDGTGEIVGAIPGAGANTAALQSLLAGVSLRGDETREVRNNIVTTTQEEGYGASLQADYEINPNLTLTSITAYREWNVFIQREGDFLDRSAAYPGSVFSEIQDTGPQNNDTFTQELRLASSAEERLRYVVGLFYYKANAERTLRRDVRRCESTTAVADATGLTPCTPNLSVFASTFSTATFGSEFENVAAFGQIDFDLTDQLTLVAGLRAARDELNITHNRTPAALPLNAVTTNPSGWTDSVDDTNVSGKVGLQFAVTPNVQTYATYTRGYKGPAFNVFFNQQQAQRAPLPPEESDAYEIGVKSTLADGLAVVNLAVFRADYENYQSNTFDVLNNSVVTRLNNIGEVSTTGFELEGTLRPTEDLNLSGAVAYAEARTEAFLNDLGARVPARDDEQLSLAPELQYTFNIDYTVRPQNLPFIVRFDTQYSYTDDQFSDLGEAELLKIDAYGIWDARITFSDREERTQFSLIGRNLTDESFASLITPEGPSTTQPLNARLARYQIPREADRYFGVSIRSKFGG